MSLSNLVCKWKVNDIMMKHQSHFDKRFLKTIVTPLEDYKSDSTKQLKINCIAYNNNTIGNKLVAKGTLVIKEKTYVTGGNMLGEQ